MLQQVNISRQLVRWAVPGYCPMRIQTHVTCTNTYADTTPRLAAPSFSVCLGEPGPMGPKGEPGEAAEALQDGHCIFHVAA